MKKLHLGCFNKKIHGYVNVDIRDDIQPDVVDDIFTLTKFEDNSVDVIYACHVLEHLKRAEIQPALARGYRILKIGGIVRIAVPDMERIFEHYIYHKDLLAIISSLGGSQRHNYDYHYSHFDFKLLKQYLELSGFKNIQRYDRWQTEHAYVDDYSAAYMPHKDFTNGQLISLNVEAVKLK